ncbi:hypothetical protein [Enterococcus faecalis]|uniref:hypothetical protein n=1 Tax=Enterococcus faecalis TaxID=1351 RepID=UPI002430670F|nr:hypothetical protein [Enterococcus faecalis]
MNIPIIKAFFVVYTVFFCFTVNTYASGAPIGEKDNQPDLKNMWNIDKRFLNSGSFLRNEVSKGIYKDLNTQLSEYKLPSKVGESIQVPLKMNIENANYYYYSQTFDKSKLKDRDFWQGIRNNFQYTILLKNKFDLRTINLKTENNSNASDFELTFDKKYIYAEKDIYGNVVNKETTFLTIKKVRDEQKLDKVIVSFDTVYFHGEGYFQGPWGFWDGTYSYRLFEPGQWSDDSYGIEYPQEEFRADTPTYYYRTKPEGELNPFSITLEAEQTLTAEPVSQDCRLGWDTSLLDYSKLVKNVKLGTKILTPDQYELQLINPASTDTVGDKIAKVKVTLKSDPSKTVDLDVPFAVKWGNSVVYGSYARQQGRTSAAFTLYPETNPYIVASQGGTIDDNNQIHELFNQYYAFNWFDLTNKESIKIEETNNGDKYIKANGNELKKDKLKEWGINQKQAVNYGDIVRAWQVETSKNWLYENEEPKLYNNNQQSIYYEITQSGYRPLHFNQLTPKTGKIPIYSTNQYLDEHVTDYIDLKNHSNINVKGFAEYPDTTSSGDKRAKILVEETLTTGKKVQYEYEVTINVEPGTLTYTVPKTLTFKEFSKSKNEQIVQRKYSGSLGLLIKDNRGSNNQGNWTLTAKASSDLKGLAPYLIYRNEKGADSYLNGSAVPVYTQDKQVSATEPLEVEVSSKWKSTDGILLKIPSKNNLASQEYSTIITWNLVEGP